MVAESLKGIYAYRLALWKMAVTQLKAKYSSSLLGVFWAAVNPLLIMLAVTFVFSCVLNIGIKDFPLFALAGILPWMFFSSGLSDATVSVLSQQSLLRQFNLPREVLPLSAVLSDFLNFLAGWVVIYPLFLYHNPAVIWSLPLLCLVMLLNLVFVCGLGLSLSALNVFMRDIGSLLGVLLMFWFWVTPVFYSSEMVPQQFQWVLNINPMTAYVVFYREVLFFGRAPSIELFCLVLGWAAAFFITGAFVFSRMEKGFLKGI